jgi:methionine-rich copper-binding protein CopC
MATSRIPRRAALALPPGLLLASHLAQRLAHPLVAQAHANLVQADPAPGVLPALPDTLNLSFSERLYQGSAAHLLDWRGTPVDGVSSNIDPADLTHLAVTVPPVGPGQYTVAWTSISADDGDQQSSFYALIAGTQSLAVSPPALAPGVPLPSDLTVQLSAAPDGQGLTQWLVAVGGPTASIVQRVMLRFQPLSADLGVSQVVADWSDTAGGFATSQGIALASDWQSDVIVRRSGVADDLHLPFTWTAAPPG